MSRLLSGVRSSWRHVREELGLVLGDELELLGLLLEAAARELDLVVLDLEQLRLVVQLGGLRLELRVGRLELLRGAPRCACSTRSC